MTISRRTSLRLLAAGALFPTNLSAAPTPGKKLGIALCGLGNYSARELAPALLETELCHLTGIITGSQDKVPGWKKRYGIKQENVFSYDTMSDLAGNTDIDIVYIVTPHGLHFRDTMAALKAGKHVFVEKPMAGTADECRQMIAAAKENGVTLNTGYRLHYDPFNNAIREAARENVIGSIERIDSGHGYNAPKPNRDAWQLNKKLSVGGVLYSTGVYPIQASLYVMRENPVRVTATAIQGDPDYYKEVTAGYSWTLDFPSGAQAHNRSTAIEQVQFFDAQGSTGELRLEPSFTYRGLAGHINGEKLSFLPTNQQALHMDGMCRAIMAGEETLTPATMGLRDVIILEAIMESAATGKPVELPDFEFPPHT